MIPVDPILPAAGAPAQSTSGLCRRDRKGRRVVSIAGPVHQLFVENCRALKLVMQDEATEQLHRWNLRHKRRAAAALKLTARHLND